MIRRISLAALALLIAVPVAAQSSDYRMRVDRSTNAADPDDVPEVTIANVGNGFQVNTGPAAIVWRDGQTATRPFTLSATFTLQEPSSHPNYYGLFYGGGDLDGASQNYMYFLVAQNGTYIVKHRANNDAVHDVQARTRHEAVRVPGDEGTSVNRLEVRVGESRTEFVINGTVVHSVDNSGMAGRTNGIWGVRINHVIPGVLVEGLGTSQ